ncbi:hypothetical protein U9M48_040907 [Paspalum notatum var. saurae]|uniref:Uncharacterized protein n=1 Tax=Paspalum notatum var. saurae TaxID=547442 RepID=A0AAQ3UM36_PASNO
MPARPHPAPACLRASDPASPTHHRLRPRRRTQDRDVAERATGADTGRGLAGASTGDDDWPGRRLPTARARRRPVAREDGEGAATPHGDGGSPRQLHTVTARARRAGGAADEEGSAQAAHGRLRGARAAAPREGETERKRGQRRSKGGALLQLQQQFAWTVDLLLREQQFV